jgi:hypothetical protein
MLWREKVLSLWESHKNQETNHANLKRFEFNEMKVVMKNKTNNVSSCRSSRTER